MYYLVQSNIHFDPEHHKTFGMLEELGLPYEAIDLQSNTQSIDVNTDRKDIFVYGSVRLARLAKAHTDWKPGSFYGGNHLFEVYSQHYKEHLLNNDSIQFKITDPIEWLPDEQKFIKPLRDAKIFIARVFTRTKWDDFVAQALTQTTTTMLHGETMAVASVPKKIIKEARVWIIGGQVIGAVYYKFHGNIPFEQAVSVEGIDFAREMVNIFNVADAFVMDIGLTNDGWKIVEINCINSAGFYTLNLRTLFRALEAYFS